MARNALDSLRHLLDRREAIRERKRIRELRKKPIDKESYDLFVLRLRRKAKERLARDGYLQK